MSTLNARFVTAMARVLAQEKERSNLPRKIGPANNPRKPTRRNEPPSATSAANPPYSFTKAPLVAADRRDDAPTFIGTHQEVSE